MRKNYNWRIILFIFMFIILVISFTIYARRMYSTNELNNITTNNIQSFENSNNVEVDAPQYIKGVFDTYSQDELKIMYENKKIVQETIYKDVIDMDMDNTSDKVEVISYLEVVKYKQYEANIHYDVNINNECYKEQRLYECAKPTIEIIDENNIKKLKITRKNGLHTTTYFSYKNGEISIEVERFNLYYKIDGGYLRYDEIRNMAIITGCCGAEEEIDFMNEFVNIPYRIDGNKVTQIKSGAFDKCRAKFVVIQDPTIKIDEEAIPNTMEVVEENDTVFLYQGFEIKSKVGDTDSLDAYLYMSEQNPQKYNVTFYNYEQGRFAGTTVGRYKGDTGGYESVENVKTFAFSKQYNVFPRSYVMLNELPIQLVDMIDCSNIDVMEIDLDGDNKNEYIVCSQKDYSEYDTDSEEAVSSVVLLNSEFEKIADIVTYTDDFIDGYKSYLSIDDITCIDIDEDGIMEILMDIPGWEWCTVKIVKYANGRIYEGSNIKAFSIAP